MARQIRLRFAATCHDCGAHIEAGDLARWFGRGRVSCCGMPTPSAPAPYVDPNIQAPAPAPLAADKEAAKSTPGLTAEELGSGIPEHWMPKLAETDPGMLLLVRLRSGARFIVPARDGAHVIRCISESLMDGVRDVTRSVNQ